MRSVPRRLSIVMMAVLSLTACKRRGETQGTPGEPAPAPAPAPAPTAAPGAASADAAAPADGAGAAALPWVTGPACDASGDLDPTLGVPCLYTWATPTGPTPLAVHLDELDELRLVAELDGTRAVVVHLAETNFARGSRVYLRPQPDQRLAVVLVEDWSEDGTEPATAEAWLLGRTGKTVEVTPLDKKAEPRPAWASATPPPAAAAPVPEQLRPRSIPECTTGLATPEDVCACVEKLPQEDEASLGGFGCTVHDTGADSVKLGEVTQEDGDMYFVMYRTTAGWAALFVVGSSSRGGAITDEFEVTAALTRIFGTRKVLRIEVDDVEVDVEESPRVRAETTRILGLCLLGEAGAPSCVLRMPLSVEERRGKLPDEIWFNPEEPSEHLDTLRVVSSYRLRVEVSDDGKATIAVAKGKPPEDVRRALGTYALW